MTKPKTLHPLFGPQAATPRNGTERISVSCKILRRNENSCTTAARRRAGPSLGWTPRAEPRSPVRAPNRSRWWLRADEPRCRASTSSPGSRPPPPTRRADRGRIPSVWRPSQRPRPVRRWSFRRRPSHLIDTRSRIMVVREFMTQARFIA